MRPGDLPEFERRNDYLCEHPKQYGEPEERDADHFDSNGRILHWIPIKPTSPEASSETASKWIEVEFIVKSFDIKDIIAVLSTESVELTINREFLTKIFKEFEFVRLNPE